MNKTVSALLASLAFIGCMTSASASTSEDVMWNVLELGTCYTPKRTIKFYPGGKADLLPANYKGGPAVDDPDDPNSYQNAYNGKEDGNGGVWTTWRVAGKGVQVLWLKPKYWSPLAINFKTSVCHLQ